MPEPACFCNGTTADIDMRTTLDISPRAKHLRERYLAAPLMIDIQYIEAYTARHRSAGEELSPLELRAECHASAMEALEPVIRDGELIVGSKTRYVRGAIPYCNYASAFVLREFKEGCSVAQDLVTDLGTGGGIARSRDLAGDGRYRLFGGKFLLREEDREKLLDCAHYFESRCMQGVGDRIWKKEFGEADYIEKGWQAGLYTAPHDPAPEGRYILDFETALGEGLLGVIARIEKQIKAADPDKQEDREKLVFWRSARRVLEATLRWAEAHAERAEALAGQLSEDDSAGNEERISELLAIAERCRHVPAHPPRNFVEACQAFWFIYLAGHIEGAHLGYSPGRFDRYMWPYFRASYGEHPDEAGRREARELVELLRVKMTELEYVASFSWAGLGSGNLFQNMILGGLDGDGRPAVNELSVICIEAARVCQTIQPTLSIWHDPAIVDQARRERNEGRPGCCDRFLREAVACVKTGCGFPAFFNYPKYHAHEWNRMKSEGVTESDIRTYAAMGGCTEPTLEGMSYGIVQAGFINLVKLLELAMNGGRDPVTGLDFGATPIPADGEELEAAFLTHLKRAVANWQRYWNLVMKAHKQTCELVFSAALVRDCVGRGRSLDSCGALNNGTPTTLSSGMVNVVNAIAAVRHLCDGENKICDLDELRRACADDWRGWKELHKAVMEAPKWGNGDDRADSIYLRLFDAYCDIVQKQENYLGKPYDPSMLAISTPAPFGKVCGATPDGRRAGECLADGVTSPTPGTDKKGPLSVLVSAGKLDHSRIRGGLHNMKFHPSALEGDAGTDALLALVEGYFRTGGFQLQFNVVDSKMLRRAQEHPDEYRDLIVRVAGFSGFFVELGKTIQDQIIDRTEHLHL